MITRVRIAPMEHWCEPAKTMKHKWKPGMLCAIETTSMVRKRLKCHPEEARFWGGPGRDGTLICEHMLELD